MTTPSSAPTPSGPLQVFTDFILRTLIPLLLPSSNNDPALARAAALAAMAPYQHLPPADLMLAAQAFAFDLAAFDTLRLSANPDNPSPVTARLRASAGSMNRAAAQARKALERRHPAPKAERTKPATAAKAVDKPRSPAPHPVSQPIHANPKADALWADACAAVARELSASLPFMTPNQRQDAQQRVRMLTQTAQQPLPHAASPVSSAA